MNSKVKRWLCTLTHDSLQGTVRVILSAEITFNTHTLCHVFLFLPFATWFTILHGHVLFYRDAINVDNQLHH